jgi:hypothetical protein
MIQFNEVMTQLYNQIAEVKTGNLLPYYLFVSKDIYEILRSELPSTPENQGVPKEYVALQYVEGMEVVVFTQPEENFIQVKGIKTNVNK